MSKTTMMMPRWENSLVDRIWRRNWFWRRSEADVPRCQDYLPPAMLDGRPYGCQLWCGPYYRPLPAWLCAPHDWVARTNWALMQATVAAREAKRCGRAVIVGEPKVYDRDHVEADEAVCVDLYWYDDIGEGAKS